MHNTACLTGGDEARAGSTLANTNTLVRQLPKHRPSVGPLRSPSEHWRHDIVSKTWLCNGERLLADMIFKRWTENLILQKPGVPPKHLKLDKCCVSVLLPQPSLWLAPVCPTRNRTPLKSQKHGNKSRICLMQSHSQTRPFNYGNSKTEQAENT